MLRSLPARTLLEPTWWACPEYAFTLGPEVAEICAMTGFAPEPEQQLLLDGTFGVAANGKSAAFEVDTVAARRNLKTGYIVQCILGWLFVTEERKVMYTAHDLQAAQETWETVAGLIEATPALARQLRVTRGDRPGITEGNGRWAIDLDNPRRTVIFRTRGKNTGRALSGDKVVFDEGFAATHRQVGSVLPVLGAVPDPQYILASSAGMVGSDVLIDARDRGRRGGSERQLYAEWGDRRAGEGCDLGKECDHSKNAEGCVLDDEERWAEIMPALDGRVQRETIRALRQSMPPKEFAREFMVWWDLDGAEGELAVDLDAWRTAAPGRTSDAELASDDAPSTVAAIGVAVSFDQAFASIGAVSAEGEHPTIGAVDRRRGTAWLYDEVVRIATEHQVPVVIDGLGPGSFLIGRLEDAGVEVITAGTSDVIDACSLLTQRLAERTVRHGDHEDLNDAVLLATWRSVGERRAFGRKGGDISMLEAVTLALWAALVEGVSSIYEDRGMRSL